MNRMAWAICCLGLFGAFGCAKRPVLYPNDKLAQVGNAVAEQDIDDCMRRGKEYVGSGAADAAQTTAGHVGVGAAGGAAVGAVGGAIYGDAGRGAAAGAATGATAGLLSGIFSPPGPDPTLAAFVDRCLRERGYEPIGWK